MMEDPGEVSRDNEFGQLVDRGLFDEAFDLYWSGLGNRLRKEGRHREDLNAIRRLLPADVAVVAERDAGWVHYMAAQAYLNNGRPRVALRHLARAHPPHKRAATDVLMRAPRLLLSAQCAVLLGDLKVARDQLFEIRSHLAYAAGHRISATLALGHVALLTGETNAASAAILQVTRLLDDAKGDLSGFAPELLWQQALVERYAAASERLGELARRLLVEEDVQYKYKGHLLLTSMYRKHGDFAEGDAEAARTEKHLLGNKETYRFGNLMIERAKLAVAQRSFAAARSAAEAALKCAEAGELLPIRIEAELLLSEVAFGMEEAEPGRALLESARLRLQGRPADVTFAALERRLAKAAVVVSGESKGSEKHEAQSTGGRAAPPSLKTWDVFLSHASEDKESIAIPLVRALEQRGLRVWYDASVLQIGDRLRERIEEGLRNSSAAVVILSRDFFRKQWTRLELDGLFSLEEATGKKILPVWHSLEQGDVARYSPILAGRLAGRTSDGIDNLANLLVGAVTGVPSSDHSHTHAAALLEFDEDSHVIGGIDAVRAFASEVRYSSERSIEPPFKVEFRTLTSLRRALVALNTKNDLTPADRIVKVKLQQEHDRYRATEGRLTRAIAILLGHCELLEAYISSDLRLATTLWGLLQLFREGALPKVEDGYLFDLVFGGKKTVICRVSLTRDEAKQLQARIGAEKLNLIISGGYEPSADELPNNVVASQVIPTIVFFLTNTEVDRDQIATYLDLSRWTCGLA